MTVGKRKSSKPNLYSSPNKSGGNGSGLEIRAQHFQGPIPPPDTLAKYEKIIPGAAERILAMAEKQGNHRRNLEAKVIDKDSGRASRGQIFAFIITITIIVGGFVMVWQGKSLEGMASIIGAITALVGVFIYGKVSKNRNLKNRR